MRRDLLFSKVSNILFFYLLPVNLKAATVLVCKPVAVTYDSRLPRVRESSSPFAYNLLLSIS